ncbi:hypothetical protein TIFTF001_001392 [Ficus carica]|uniref:TF-B3 domain-containing protein n=1 Tax=Ficus carica TaxID=3494 RepID=A0AA88CR19_FICCA|nr:hypothetical protein TIFTF001_001392 [Ficus carica]
MELMFRKSLKWTDVHARLLVPTKCLNKFPRTSEGVHTFGLQVRDADGSLWRFRCAVRKTGYRKPVLSGDWHRFVVSKGLSIGDEIKFYKEHHDDGQESCTGAQQYYRVEVKKALVVFGVVFGLGTPYMI